MTTSAIPRRGQSARLGNTDGGDDRVDLTGREACQPGLQTHLGDGAQAR